jgi:S1-C subfamily serine protease
MKRKILKNNVFLGVIVIFSTIFIYFAFLNHKNSLNICAENFSPDDQSATISAINKAMPAVVSILVYESPEIQEGIKLEKELKGSGTGFLISSDGYILTNKHVINVSEDEKAEYKIILNSKKKYYAQLIGRDPINDLAVLKIFDKNLPYLELDSQKTLPVGSTVLAIGNVLGKYQNSVTKGIISASGRTVTAIDNFGNYESLDNVLQTDAEINVGNSGGPLINLNGKVVGVNVALDMAGSSIGFAIPASDVKVVVNSVKTIGRIVRPRLGVRYIVLDQEKIDELGLTVENGALVVNGPLGESAVISGSPAEKIELKKDDIILEVNTIKINQENSLLAILQNYKPGQKVGLRILREGKILVKEVVLDEFK